MSNNKQEQQESRKNITVRELLKIVGGTIVLGVVIFGAIEWIRINVAQAQAQEDIVVANSALIVHQNETGNFPPLGNYEDFADMYKKKYPKINEKEARGWDYTLVSYQKEYALEAHKTGTDQWIICDIQGFCNIHRKSDGEVAAAKKYQERLQVLLKKERAHGLKVEEEVERID